MAGLLLAGLGLWTGRRARQRPALGQGTGACAGGGRFRTGAGVYDPLYFLLYKLVPGFDLFVRRALDAALHRGVAVLVGYGVDGWFMTSRGPLTGRLVSHPRSVGGSGLRWCWW